MHLWCSQLRLDLLNFALFNVTVGTLTFARSNGRMTVRIRKKAVNSFAEVSRCFLKVLRKPTKNLRMVGVWVSLK